MGLNYFGARYYDADIGLWTSVDPCRQHWSGYTYGSNNPINRIDPDGCWDTKTDNPVYQKAMERREQGNVDPSAASDAFNEITPEMIPAMATPEFAEGAINTQLFIYGFMIGEVGLGISLAQSAFDYAEGSKGVGETIVDVGLNLSLYRAGNFVDDYIAADNLGSMVMSYHFQGLGVLVNETKGAISDP